MTPPPQTAVPNVKAFTPILNGKKPGRPDRAMSIPRACPPPPTTCTAWTRKYQPFGITTYDHSTPKTSLPGDFSSHTVSAAISGLLPDAVYHVRLIANNANGQMIGPDRDVQDAG